MKFFSFFSYPLPPPPPPPGFLRHFLNKETLLLQLRPEGSIYAANKKHVGNALAMTVTPLPGINILNILP